MPLQRMALGGKIDAIKTDGKLVEWEEKYVWTLRISTK